MINVHVTKPNKEFNALYKDIYDDALFKSVYEKRISISNDSYFSRYMFMTSMMTLANFIGAEKSKEMIIYECTIFDSMKVYTVDTKDDYIYESYSSYVKTNMGNFAHNMIPPHSVNNPIRNDFEFVEKMYNKMELDIDFQNVPVVYNGKEDFPVRYVQLDVLVAMYKYINKKHRADFLYICKEFYDMIKDVNSYTNVRIKKISSRNNLDMHIYNPSFAMSMCDNIDRVVKNEESGNAYLVGYSTNFKEPITTNILDEMKHM